MICFSLVCGNGHRFDSWFTSSAAFEGLNKSGHVICPVCGSAGIEKALMAPAIATAAVPATVDGQAPQATISAQTAVAQAMAQMRALIEQNSDYVGMNFAAEARAMHLGDTPARPIYGEARTDEARALIEDGIPVAPLPFLPRAKVN